MAWKASPTSFDPYAIDSHYGLDMACLLLHAEEPRSVRVCSHDPTVVLAAARRLSWVDGDLFVETPEIARAVHDRLGVWTTCYESGQPVDGALIPLSWCAYREPPAARIAVVMAHNAISYKSLIYPGRVPGNVFALMRWLRPDYHIQHRLGLFTPSSLLKWAASISAGTRRPAAHFWMGQRALDSIYSTSPFWWLGYVVLLIGRRRS